MRKNPESSNRTTPINRGEQGFSLLELVISMVVFLIVTGAIYGMLRVAQNSRSGVSQQVQLTKSLRLGLNIIGRDTYNAGYGYPLTTVVLENNKISPLLGIPGDSESTRDTVPPIIAGNNITINNLNGVAGASMDQVTFLYKDPTFNVSGAAGNQLSQPLSANITAAASASDPDLITPTSGSNAAINVNDLLLVVGKTSSTLVVASEKEDALTVKIRNGDLIGFNKSKNGFLSLSVPLASVQRVKMLTYFVTSDGILTRREYVNADSVAFVDEPLVYNIANFQIQYVLDDGSISNNPSAGVNGTAGDSDDNQAILAKVRQIRFTVTVRTSEGNATGQLRETTMSSTFSTRNLGYSAN